MKNVFFDALKNATNKQDTADMLAPCPFCGCGNLSLRERFETASVVISCHGCGVSVSYDFHRNNCTDALVSSWWNRRADTQLKRAIATTDVSDLFQPLFVEFCRAVVKHPKWPTDAIHASAILNEEAGELTQVAIDFHFSGDGREHMREEAIQVGAMVLRFLMNLDGYKPEGGAA